MCASDKWSKVSVIVRRELDDWKNINGKEKLDIIKVESLDELENI